MHTDFYTLTISFVHTQLTNSFPFAELPADICCLTRWAASDHAMLGRGTAARKCYGVADLARLIACYWRGDGNKHQD